MERWLELLKDKIDPGPFEKAMEEEDSGGDPAGFLLDRKLISPKSLLCALSHYYSLPSLEVEYYYPDKDALSMISEEVARRFLILPLFILEESLYVALSDSDDLTAQDYLRQLTGLTVEPVLALKTSIEGAINRHYLSAEQAAQRMTDFHEKMPEVKIEEEEEEIRIEDEEAPAIKLLNYILSQAINLGTSDIHLEAFPEKVMLRYRIDGVLHEFPHPPLHLYRAIVSRIKIISNLDVAEHRLPQDGRAAYSIKDRDYDMRISIIPNLHGEGVVIRILDTKGKGKDLDELGFSPSMLEQYKKIIKKPYGILLVTGPTGSGKSTTLYATLKHIYTPEKKIITLEDPVEYQLFGVTQIQVRPDIGFTFGVGLRSILRHDPDTVMLGEIRDLESAEIAIRASLTGHSVFSTLHTNDAPSSVVRLIDMGVPSFMVFSSLNGIMAQRLIRRLCPACKVKVSMDKAMLISPGLEGIPEGSEIYEPKGCGICGNIGYKGRIAIYELLEITEKMRHLSPEELTQEKIVKLAQETGFKTLRENALEKLLQGITSLEEVLSVT